MTSDHATSPAPPDPAPVPALAASPVDPAPSAPPSAPPPGFAPAEPAAPALPAPQPSAPAPPAAQRPLRPKDIYFPFWPRDGEPYITKTSHPEYFEYPDFDDNADSDPNGPAAASDSDDPTPITPASFNRALAITDLIERVLQRNLEFLPGREIPELEIASRIVMRTIAIRKTILRLTTRLTRSNLQIRNRNRNRNRSDVSDATTAPEPSLAPDTTTADPDPDSDSPTIAPLLVREVRTVPQVPPSRDIRRDLLGADPEHAVARALGESPASEPLPRDPITPRESRAKLPRAPRASKSPASLSADLSPQARALPRPIHLFAADRLPFTFEELADASPSELEEARDDYERNMIYALEVAMDEEVFYDGFCDDYLAAFPYDTT